MFAVPTTIACSDRYADSDCIHCILLLMFFSRVIAVSSTTALQEWQPANPRHLLRERDAVPLQQRLRYEGGPEEKMRKRQNMVGKDTDLRTGLMW